MLYYKSQVLVRYIYSMCSWHYPFLNWTLYTCLLTGQIIPVPVRQYKPDMLWRYYVTTRDELIWHLYAYIFGGGTIGSMDGYVFTTYNLLLLGTNRHKQCAKSGINNIISLHNFSIYQLGVIIEMISPQDQIITTNKICRKNNSI